MASDCIYRPNDPALHKAPGRTAYGTVKSKTFTGATLSGTNLYKSNGVGPTRTCGITSGSTTVTGTGFGVYTGLRVYGVGITVPTYVKSVTSSSELELDRPAEVTNASVSLVFSDVEPGDYATGSLTAPNTTVTAVVDGSNLTLSTAPTAGTDTVVVAPTVKSLAFLSFPGTGKDVLLAYAGSKIYSSAYGGLTGTFVAFITGLSNSGGETLEAIKTGNTYLLLSTRNAPRIVTYSDVSGTDTLVARFAGMQAVTSCTAEVTSGQWPSSLGNGYYYFLVTEVVHPGEGNLEAESTFDGDPQPVHISDFTTQCALIRRPATVNNGIANATPTATHWRIYMSPPQPELLEVPALHLFRRVGPKNKDGAISIDQTSFVLGDANPITGYVSPTTYTYTNPGCAVGFLNPDGLLAPVGQVTGTASFGSGVSSITFTRVSGAANPSSGDPVYGSGIAGGTVVVSYTGTGPWTLKLNKPTSGASGAGSYYVGPASSAGDMRYAYDNGAGGRSVNLKKFNFRNDSDNAYYGKTVVGVGVRLYYKWDNVSGSDNSGNDRGFNVSLYFNGTLLQTKLNVGHKSGQGSTPTFGGNRWGLIECGGNGDTWGRTWSAGLADFVDGVDASEFAVNITVADSADFINHWIESVEVCVYFSGADVNLNGEAFPTVIYTSQIGEEVTIGAAGPPPASDSGDVFEGQAILVDTNNPNVLWASAPDEFEKYPSYYQINVASIIYTPIRAFRRLAATGIILCQSAIKRLNYFPTEADANAQRGRAWEDLTTEAGLVSKHGVTLFDYPGRGPVCAFISSVGLMLTDGITVWQGNVDLDWETTVATDYLNTCELVNYPRLHMLAFYYVPYGETVRSKVFYFCYHPTHLKNNGMQLSAVGPVQCRSGCAIRTNLGNITRLLTGNLSDGKVYVEDNGLVSADALVTITPRVRTRTIYPSDVGEQARIEKAWLRVGGYGDVTTGVIHVNILRQNIGEGMAQVDTAVATTDASTISGDRLVPIFSDNLGESFQVEVTKDSLAADFDISYLYLLGTGYGSEFSRA